MNLSKKSNEIVFNNLLSLFCWDTASLYAKHSILDQLIPKFLVFEALTQIYLTSEINWSFRT